MSERIDRDWSFYVKDMIAFCEKVISYTDGFGQAEFVKSGMTYDATLRNLELIGEAATHIPETVRQENPDIPWRLIIATRIKLIHGYLGIDDDTLWSIITTDVVALLPRLQHFPLQDKHRAE